MISSLITITTIGMIALQLSPIEANNDCAFSECQSKNDALGKMNTRIFATIMH